MEASWRHDLDKMMTKRHEGRRQAHLMDENNGEGELHLSQHLLARVLTANAISVRKSTANHKA